MIITEQVTSEVSSQTLLIKLLIFCLLIGIGSNIAARNKGRNIAAWTIIGFIPIVNFFSAVLLFWSSNLKTTFGGRNVGKIAKSIAYHHNRLGSFVEVIQIYLSHFKSLLDHTYDSEKYNNTSFAITCLRITLNSEIKAALVNNYSDLAALTLLVYAAPPNHSFTTIGEDYGKEFETRLQEHGLSNELVSGSALDV